MQFILSNKKRNIYRTSVASLIKSWIQYRQILTNGVNHTKNENRTSLALSKGLLYKKFNNICIPNDIRLLYGILWKSNTNIIIVRSIQWICKQQKGSKTTKDDYQSSSNWWIPNNIQCRRNGFAIIATNCSFSKRKCLHTFFSWTLIQKVK